MRPIATDITRSEVCLCMRVCSHTDCPAKMAKLIEMPFRGNGWLGWTKGTMF